MSSMPMRTRGQEQAHGLGQISSGMPPWVPVDELSDTVNIGEDDPHKFLSMAEERCNFDVDAAHLGTDEQDILALPTTHHAPLISSSSFPNNGNVSKVTKDVCKEERPRLRGTKSGWDKPTAALKAKCEVLRMQKEVAKQQWEERCTDMAESAQIARCLRVAVESILDTERRPRALSAPCTPRRRVPNEGHSLSLDERLRTLKASSALRSKAMNAGAHKNLENLPLVFQTNTGMFPKSCQFQCSNLCTAEESGSETQQSDHEHSHSFDEELAKQKKTKTTVREILTQINTEAEQWKQVQEVLKNVIVEMTTVKQACARWEKRTLDSEHLATVRQREGEEWRVKAQAAEQKNSKLEAELTELQDTIEGIKQRHALERSRWLEAGGGQSTHNNLGYTVILQPFANKDTLDKSTRCAKQRTSTRQSSPWNRISEPSKSNENAALPSRPSSPSQQTCGQISKPDKIRQSPESARVRPARPSEGPKTITGSKTGAEGERSGRGRSISVDRGISKDPGRKSISTRNEAVSTHNKENQCASMNDIAAVKKTLAMRAPSNTRKLANSPAPACKTPASPRFRSEVLRHGPLQALSFEQYSNKLRHTVKA